jgi:hypothetical protein
MFSKSLRSCCLWMISSAGRQAVIDQDWNPERSDKQAEQVYTVMMHLHGSC